LPDLAEDESMMFLRMDRLELVSGDLAVHLSEMLIERIYGRDELAQQTPLQLTEKPETWLVKGSRQYDDSVADGDLVYGRTEIEIVKANCHVIRFTRYAAFASHLYSEAPSDNFD
jgi:NTF2 fold immunity protein